MVLLVDGVRVDDWPSESTTLSLRFPTLITRCNRFCSMKAQVLGPLGVLYVSSREFAVTHPHDSKISVLATDDVTTAIIMVLRHTGSGASALCQMDRVMDEGVTAMLQRMLTISYPYEGRVEAHVFGAFDEGHVNLSSPLNIIQCLQKLPHEVDLVHWCVGESATVERNGVRWPMVYGVGVNLRSGSIFPATVTDKGPDLDIRHARTLTNGDNVGMLEVYDSSREELRIGPFSYGPIRSVDLLLAQSDDFLLQNLSPAPKVAPPHFVSQLRSTLRRIKDDPYPSVTLFHNNQARLYRKDDASGAWVRVNKDNEEVSQHQHHHHHHHPHLHLHHHQHHWVNHHQGLQIPNAANVAGGNASTAAAAAAAATSHSHAFY